MHAHQDRGGDRDHARQGRVGRPTAGAVSPAICQQIDRILAIFEPAVHHSRGIAAMRRNRGRGFIKPSAQARHSRQQPSPRILSNECFCSQPFPPPETTRAQRAEAAGSRDRRSHATAAGARRPAAGPGNADRPARVSRVLFALPSRGCERSAPQASLPNTARSW